MELVHQRISPQFGPELSSGQSGMKVTEFARDLVVSIERSEVTRTSENERELRTSSPSRIPIATIRQSPNRAKKPADLAELARHDVVRIEISFEFRFGDELSLRPEATASVCRAYIEHGMHAWAQPVKLYYMGPMFRRERPQKGRYRQFYQIGAEVLESASPQRRHGGRRKLRAEGCGGGRGSDRDGDDVFRAAGAGGRAVGD